MLRDRLEISEQERKNHQANLIDTLEKMSHYESSNTKQLQSPKNVAETKDEEKKGKVNIELILRKHINYENLISVAETRGLQDLYEKAIDQLESVAETMNKLQKLSEETIRESCYQVN